MAKKDFYDVSNVFIEYEEFIVNHPNYSGMPDVRKDDGTIQWEAPSNRSSGKFQFTHDRRASWWRQKAIEVGINPEENHWISKTAKLIHPTKRKPCKYCGRVMDIRYCYLSANIKRRIQKLSFVDEALNLEGYIHIFDFLQQFTTLYGDDAYSALPTLLKCKQCTVFPRLENRYECWCEWLERSFIPLEPSVLSPGVMANPPDRLDGFHSFNNCCRSTADKGRSKSNLASYSTDRRAFENWVDGNWIKANKLMGYINSNEDLNNQECANHTLSGTHPTPCSADHIGPISLGFCHRPEFQLLCKPCNSAKNNRMYFSDVLHLIDVENHGETVASWYAQPIWDLCKNNVTSPETALRLSKIMRDNRNVAMLLLYEFLRNGHVLFLFTLLNLNYADYDYEIIESSVSVTNHIVTTEFTQRNSNLRYVAIQKIRKILVAYSSLVEYALKENRNGYRYSSPEIEELKSSCNTILSDLPRPLANINQNLASILDSSHPEHALTHFLNNINYEELCSNEIFVSAKEILIQIMQEVANELSSNWNDSRYVRE